MVKIIFCKGLPASGKSTWASQYCKDNINFIRLNKDDLREELQELNKQDTWNRDFEKLILDTQREKGISLLKSGKSIIIDDTNFSNIHWEYWNNIAEKMGISIELKYFDTPVDECVDRDKHREKSVGEDVIRSMYKKYVKHNISKIDSRFIVKQDKSLPKCIIVDIDGTLALINGRNPYDDTLIHTDKPNTPVVNIVKRFKNFYTIDNFFNPAESLNRVIIISGRMDKCRPQTVEWLLNNNIQYDALFMRKTDDYRQDSVVKREIYEKYIKNFYNVEAWFDDRDQVVKMVREELGLLCLQVYYGNF